MTTTITPAEARDYLGDYLNQEAEDHPDAEDWFYDLEDHLRSLDTSHPICGRLVVALEPFLNDDERIGSMMYPVGETIAFLEREAPGGPFDSYLAGLTAAIEADHQRWVAHVAAAGTEAAWTVESGPPEL
ncbi:hypothetical protein Achl_4322 (plasmid) [Pseudarthrobacter chlorophenolicus A6]|uniref:Uncharacterized protein n=1 Tax=Pseudarthrobacter chlorophenolicus (strain ATCC 700700 / DSM 12829 / CIP 107037 / JCM 12360 / KCTC 9906 / NCIMB 13794 / A6) TaxID=452863 RepID=B8HIM6_PSECP|nr:hypothetical protein [Pseudarthrobacter chlorophenolicus]ACL42273.1 hypothetical protein Achl_4322 [Pseudarthrobacter chlorophenolicus A6]SDQ15776.1 hypothetical protein SAMN04489738_0380 [Pseudarthrobacter chlorophenolicus]